MLSFRFVYFHFVRSILSMPTLWGLFVAALWIGLTVDVRADEASQQDSSLQKSEQHVADLVEQLGDKSYSVRKTAEEELRQLGATAFDALVAALDHDDVEVTLHARYLLRGIQINWAQQDDVATVKNALRNYAKASSAERQSRMQLLAHLDNWQGLEALCRIVRFEPNQTLSKQAALLLLRSTQPTVQTQRDRLARRIETAMQGSRREAARWLRAYAKTLVAAEENIDNWDILIQAERDTYLETPEKSRPEIIGDLLFWQADMLRQLKRFDEAEAVILRRLDLLGDRRSEVVETLDWLIDRKSWAGVDQLEGQFAERLALDAEFLYLLAESRAVRGDASLADELAKKAFLLQPEEPAEHMRLGLVLQSRGQFDWAIQEYNHAIKQGVIGSKAHVLAYYYLSEMLHDIGRELAAAQTLEQLVEKTKTNAAVKKQVQESYRRSVGVVEARMNVFFALHYREINDKAKQLEHLEKSAKGDSNDADFLIAMYHATLTNPERRKTTVLQIRLSIAASKSELGLYEQGLAQAIQTGEDNLIRDRRTGVAFYCNQIAWLISNTAGDFDEAVRLSHRSLQMRPDTAGYFDTLGRCYYAKGDLKNAVKYQAQAVAGDPHSGQIERQYEFFRKELADSKQSPEK